MPIVFMCKSCGAVTDPEESADRVMKCDVCRRPISFYVRWDSPSEDAHAAAIIERHRLVYERRGYKRALPRIGFPEGG